MHFLMQLLVDTYSVTVHFTGLNTIFSALAMLPTVIPSVQFVVLHWQTDRPFSSSSLASCSPPRGVRVEGRRADHLV